MRVGTEAAHVVSDAGYSMTEGQRCLQILGPLLYQTAGVYFSTHAIPPL